jgi:flagellar hook-associated protein 1 FlgK
MATGDILGVGITGLLAYQRALATVSHNVTNANTPGYHRQRVELGTQPPVLGAPGYLGMGVRIETVRRLYDAFLDEQVRSSEASYRQFERYHALAAQVDNLIADPQAGLGGALGQFFAAWHDLASDPASTVARQVVLAKGEALAARFHALDARLADLARQIDGEVRNALGRINDLAAQIARLNADISALPGQGREPPANDLLDQRGQLIEQLAQYVGVTTVEQDNGALNVFIGNGQALVVGTKALALTALANEFDATRVEVGYSQGGTTASISAQLAGGTLGAALAFRREVLDPARNALGRIALGLAEVFNAQHALGLDLDGQLGGDFFEPLAASSPVASASSANTGNGVVTVTVSDVGALTASDYLLARNGAAYTLTRLSDGTVTTLSTFPSGSQTIDGLTLSLASGTIASGDRFLIRATYFAARDFAVNLSDPRRIAAAGALIAASNPANTGSARLDSVAVSSAAGLPLASHNGPITLTYDSANTRFAVSDSSGLVGYVNYDPATDSGAVKTLPAPLDFIALRFSGTPANGDVFTIADNSAAAAADNRNAAALAALETARRFLGGTASAADLYGALVGEIGSRTQTADSGRRVQQVLRDQALAARESYSGVNLDEEAADLVRYQQAYQAAAQVIATADSLFQTLLFLLRR